MNYNSYSPEIYKNSIVKTLIHRAYNLCSSWEVFDLEVKRIKQNLVNCDHPISQIDKLINKTIDNLYLKSNKQQNENRIKFYFKTENPVNFNKEEKCLKNILKTHI